MSFHQRLARQGGRMALCSVAAPVGEVLEKTNLDSVLRIFPNEHEALQAV
jgi:anti-anti-sigma regulatory factor